MRSAIICGIACAFLALQSQAADVIAAADPAAMTTVTKTVTQYEKTAQAEPTQDAESPAAESSVEESSADAAETSSSASASATPIEDEEGNVWPSPDMSASDVAESSLPSAEVLSGSMATATAAATAAMASGSGSAGVSFTFTPLTLAPEKSKSGMVASSTAPLSEAPKPSAAKAESAAGMINANNLAIAAVAAVAGLAML